MLSPRKLNIQISPVKENKRDFHTASKQHLLSLLSQYQTLLSKSGIKVPENIKVNQSSPKKEIKLIPTSSSSNHSSDQEMRRLKIKINDYEFQMKKMEEDYADFKVKSKIQREKQTKRLNQQVHQLRNQLSDDNSRWEKKFQERDLIYQQQTKTYKNMVDKVYKQDLKKIKEEYEGEISIWKKKVGEVEEKMRQQYEKKISLLEKQNEEKQRRMQKNHEEEKKIVIIEQKEVIKKLQKKEEQKSLVLESQKKVEEKKHEQTKLEFSKVKDKLYTDLYYVRKEKEEQSKIISDLKKQIINLKKDYEEKEKDFIKLEEHYLLRIQENKKEYDFKVQYQKEQDREQRKSILASHTNQLVKLQSKLESMNKQKGEIAQLWKKSNEQISIKFQKRPPRQEDTEKIQKQFYELTIKEEEIKKVKDQLKFAKLQSENNEKNYTRIFSANGHRDKKNHPPLSVGKQLLYKQSNTVDMSMVFKLCNRNI